MKNDQAPLPEAGEAARKEAADNRDGVPMQQLGEHVQAVLNRTREPLDKRIGELTCRLTHTEEVSSRRSKIIDEWRAEADRERRRHHEAVAEVGKLRASLATAQRELAEAKKEAAHWFKSHEEDCSRLQQERDALREQSYKDGSRLLQIQQSALKIETHFDRIKELLRECEPVLSITLRLNPSTIIRDLIGNLLAEIRAELEGGK